jgi:hypothetical protein
MLSSSNIIAPLSHRRYDNR